VLEQIADLIAWLEPHAVILALALPPVIRVVGHWIPEELFMVAMGALAARSHSSRTAALILGAVVVSHFVTDQVVYLGGRWLRPRLGRFPRIEARVRTITARLADSPGALLGLVPARVLPLGWLAACGVVRIPWPRFAAVDLAALFVHLSVWSGLGWWFAGDMERLTTSVESTRVAGAWMAAALITATMVVILWRSRQSWQPANRGSRARRTPCAALDGLSVVSGVAGSDATGPALRLRRNQPVRDTIRLSCTAPSSRSEAGETAGVRLELR